MIVDDGLESRTCPSDSLNTVYEAGKISFEEIASKWNDTYINDLHQPLRLTGSSTSEAAKPSPDKKPNYFFIPPKFAFSLKLNFPIIPRLALYLRAFCVNLRKLLVCY